MNRPDHRRVEIPGDHHRIGVGGDRYLHVVSGGTQGATVVLLHGIPTNHRLWADVAPRLASRARFLAVDLLGYGDSSRPQGYPVDIAAQAGYVARVLDNFGVDRATVVGHDLGGGIGQILALRHHRVERLAVIDGVCYDGWPVPFARTLRAARLAYGRVPPRLILSAAQALLQRGFVHRDRAAVFLPAFLGPFDSPDGLGVLRHHLQSLDARFTLDVATELPALRIPTAVAWGSHDHEMKPRYAELLAADIPGATLTWLNDSGHFSPADDPDGVAEVIENLLARPTHATAGTQSASATS